jgi:pyruvate/2-oxoglutarate/acetoin dehydrogenase E1 component
MWTVGGYGGEIAAVIADKGIYYLEVSVKQVGARHVPIAGKLRAAASGHICTAVEQSLE